MSSRMQAQTRQGIGRLSIGSGLVVLAGVVGFVFTFFHWYGVSTASSPVTYLSGWHSWGVPVAILFLVAALVGIGRMLGYSVGSATGEGVLMAAIGVAAVVCTIIFMVTEGRGYGAGYNKGPLFGAYIGLISAIVLAVGGALVTREAST